MMLAKVPQHIKIPLEMIITHFRSAYELKKEHTHFQAVLCPISNQMDEKKTKCVETPKSLSEMKN